MSFKPANSDMDFFVLFLIKNIPCKNSYTSETGNWKRHFLKGTRITRLPHLKKTPNFLQFFISKRPAFFLNKKKHFLAVGGQTPPPLVECPAKNASFFTCSLTLTSLICSSSSFLVSSMVALQTIVIKS